MGKWNFMVFQNQGKLYPKTRWRARNSSEIVKFRNAEEARPVLKPYSFQHSLRYEMEKNETAEMLLTVELQGISIVPLTTTREYKGVSGLKVV